MSEVISVGALFVFLMILGYLCLGTCIERYKIAFGHEASFTILIGKYFRINSDTFHILRHDAVIYILSNGVSRCLETSKV